MENRLIEGLREDVARQYVSFYERLNDIVGKVEALGKTIQALSLLKDSGEVDLGYLGGIIVDKCREMDSIINGFVSYPGVYLGLQEDGQT